MTRDEALPLRKIQLWSWILLASMAVSSVVFFGASFTKALLVGGLLANSSFWLLKRDLSRLFAGELAAVKVRFFMKYYARLTVLAVLLFVLIKYGSLNIPGLLGGLSVVFLSIAGVAASSAIKTFKFREAS